MTGTRGPTSIIENHPLRDEIEDYLRNRISPITVIHLLRWRYGEDALSRMPALPHPRTLARWREQEMGPVDFLPPRLINDKLQQLDHEIDVFQSLKNLYGVAEDRAVKAIQAEEEIARELGGLSGGLSLNPATDKAIESARELLEQIWHVGQDIGAFPRAARGLSFRMPGAGGGRGAIEVDAPSDEDVTMVMEVMWKRRHSQAGTPQLSDEPGFVEGEFTAYAEDE